MIRNLSLAACAVLLLASCRRDQSEVAVAFATNEAVSAFAERSVTEPVDGLTMRGQGSTCDPFDLLPDCVEITDSGEGIYPRTIVLDFGDGCVGWNGRERSGQLLIELSGNMMEAGSVRTVSFSDFTAGNVAIAGTRVTTCEGTNGNGQPIYSRDVDMILTRNGNTFTRSADHNLTWISGFETDACGDNVIEVTGSATVIRPNGNTVTRTIIDPVVHDHTCIYITAGSISVNAPGGVRLIDFGNGSCDDVATVTIDGDTYEIDLDAFHCRRRS